MCEVFFLTFFCWRKCAVAWDHSTVGQLHELALCRRSILDVASHGWVRAGHPRCTCVHYAGKAVYDSTEAHTMHKGFTAHA